jgi:hypothetical protein
MGRQQVWALWRRDKSLVTIGESKVKIFSDIQPVA